ncbi:serine/threonine-protein kinase [Marinicella meishanensis]|uniref:serine/threonine-protein kinase n=1 Tax=Marinicella meishanensis TaxID=2873263 RepID=UPI001CBC1084|nr:serine/threonine-protein kinase [Marinicella sp. NBU2979]
MQDDLLNKAELAAAGQLVDAGTASPYDRPFQIINQLKKSFQQVTPTALIQTGEQWGHLQINKPIGQGGMGVVYEAHDTLLNRSVAVKFLNAHNSGLLSANEFIAEARHIAKVRHPHVMAVYGANTFAQITGFWSELLTGQTIDQMPDKDLTWPRVLTMATQLADAVQSIHDQGLIHGDIKPQNVILEPDKGVVLMDFGSVLDTDSELPQWQSSTPLIMAPELFIQPQKSIQSDVYALGVVFYFLSHHRTYPHMAKDLMSLQQKVNTPIRYQATVGPRKWLKLMQQMLHQEPQKRPSMGQIRAQLNQLAEAPLKRKKRLLMGALAVTLLSFIAYLQFSNQQLSAANQRTQLALNESNQLNQLLQDMLASASNINHGKDLLMTDAIDQFMDGIHHSQVITNDIKAKAMTTLANSQISLGQFAAGMNTLMAAKDLPNLSPMLALQIDINQVKFLLHDPQLNQDKLSQATQLLTAINQSPLLTDMPPAIRAELHQANMHVAKTENRYAQALQEGRLAIELWQLEPSNKTQWQHLGILYDMFGQIQGIQGNHPTAEQSHKKALDYFQKANNRPNGNTMVVRNNLAITYAKLGLFSEAHEQMTILVKETREFFGENHPRFFSQVGNLAASLADNNQATESLQLLRQHLPGLIEHLGENSMNQFYFEGLIANNLTALERYDAAEARYLKLIDTLANTLGEQHPLWYINQTNLSELYIKTNQPKRANNMLGEMIPAVTNAFGADSELAQYMIKLKRQAESASTLTIN